MDRRSVRSGIAATFSVLMLLALTAGAGAQDLILDEGPSGGGIAGSYKFVALNRFTPESFPVILDRVRIMFSDAGTKRGVDVYVYEDRDGDVTTGASCVASLKGGTVQFIYGNNWSEYELTLPVILDGPGDVIIAAVIDPDCFVSLSDNIENRSWLGVYAEEEEVPDPPTFPTPTYWHPIGSVLMIRGITSPGPACRGPLDEEGDVGVDPRLTWAIMSTTQPPSFDVWFGEEGELTERTTDLTEKNWSPGSLKAHVRYQWRIISHNASGEEISGDIWTFTTGYDREAGEAGLGGFEIASADITSSLSDDLILPESLSGDVLKMLSADSAGEVVIEKVETPEDGEYLQMVSFDIESRVASRDGEIHLLPVNLDLVISRDTMEEKLWNVLEETEGPAELANILFDEISIAKVLDGRHYDLHAIADDMAPDSANEFFAVSRDENGCTISLNLVIADEANWEDPVQAMAESGDYRYFLVFDGEKDGRFRDPLAIVEREKDSSSGGCDVGLLAPLLPLLLVPLLFLRRG